MLKATLSVLLLLAPLTCFSEAQLTSHQVLADCNRAASSLVESYEKDVPLEESERFDTLQIISMTCQKGYQSAYDGIQYEDIERSVLSSAKNQKNKLKSESKKNTENRAGLVLSAIQSGYYIYHNGGLKKKE